jgi:hypothetical protein
MAAVRQAAADAGLESVAVLVRIRDDPAVLPAVQLRAAERLLRLATLTIRAPVNQVEDFNKMSDQELYDRCPDVSKEEWDLMRTLTVYQLSHIVDPFYVHANLRHLTVLPEGFAERLRAVRLRAAAAGEAAAVDGHPALLPVVAPETPDSVHEPEQPSQSVCSLVLRGCPW